MKQTINIRMYDKDSPTGVLTPVEAEPWSNPYGVSVFIHKVILESGRAQFNATEPVTGLCLMHADKKKELIAQLEKKFNDLCLTDFGRSCVQREFQELVNENIRFYHLDVPNMEGAKHD